MSSKEELSDEDQRLLKEELGATEIKREDNPSKEDVKLDIASEEKPTNTNPYVTVLTETFNENQKEQNERAEQIVETQEFVIKKVDGTEETLDYKNLSRSQDLQVRNIQRKWFKIKSLSDKLRLSFLDEEHKDYKPFDIKDYTGSPLLKGKVTSDMSKDEVSEVLDELSEEVFGERFNKFAECFFGITQDKVDEYKYKDLTFILDVAYSVYSTVPY